MRARLNFFASLVLCLAVPACATYHPAPLPSAPPAAAPLALSSPLSLAQVQALAVQRDPALMAARAQRGIARAELLSAGLPPDPTISGGFEALLGGPASMSSIAGSLTQDVSALITYVPDKAAAKAGLAQVDAGILWQEWQVAAQAGQLCLAIAGERATLASLHAQAGALAALNARIQAQLAAHNLTLADAAAPAAALAAVTDAANSTAQSLAQDQAQLDALLALAPGTAVPLAPLIVPALPPAAVQAAIATLPARRPDLIALRYGYSQAEENLRAAIWRQFLPISVGASGGRDTSGVLSAGPQVSLTLPLFNRNRPAIAAAQATRAQLRAQYAASLASAVSGAQSLQQSILLLQSESGAADAAAAQAGRAAADAQQAFAAGALDARGEADLLAAAGERRRAAIALHTALDTAELSLATLLGLGPPPVSSEDFSS